METLKKKPTGPYLIDRTGARMSVGKKVKAWVSDLGIVEGVLVTSGNMESPSGNLSIITTGDGKSKVIQWANIERMIQNESNESEAQNAVA